MNATRKLIVAAVMAAASIATLPVHAGGFIGGLIDQVAPGVGTQLDRLNHNLQNPVDRAAAAVINGVAPGFGGLATMRSGNLDGSAQQRPLLMGNFCSNGMGRFGPGPGAPVGMPCGTPYGPGFISQ